jgi:hypothetical protein
MTRFVIYLSNLTLAENPIGELCLILILRGYNYSATKGNRKGLPLHRRLFAGAIPCGCPHRTFQLSLPQPRCVSPRTET